MKVLIIVYVEKHWRTKILTYLENSEFMALENYCIYGLIMPNCFSYKIFI